MGATLLAASAIAAGPRQPDALPGMELKSRLEAYFEHARTRLRAFPSHYALLFPMEPRDVSDFMRPIRFHLDGDAYVLGTSYAPEAHGGGVLALLLDHWRPDDRAARLGDRYDFLPNRASLELEEIYRGHQRQLFLPVPGRPAGEIDGRLPETPQLPRMRFRFWSQAEPVETDAYHVLALLLAHQPDLSASWTNHLGQRLSTELLMQHVRDYYLSGRGADAELSDHSNLHLVELLLDYARRNPGAAGAEPIQRRFLAVELERREFGRDWSEIVAHYADSLGALVADPQLDWDRSEAKKVRYWLAWLEGERFRDLDGIEIQPLTHLLRGLRRISEHRDRLEVRTPDDPEEVGVLSLLRGMLGARCRDPGSTARIRATALHAPEAP